MAQADYFLKIEGVEGESADHKHKGWIDIQSFSWGATNVAASGFGGGGGAGKVQVQDVHCASPVSKASPKLMEACAVGQHIKTGLIEVRKAGGEQQVYLTIKLSDVLVSSYQMNGTGQDRPIPLDSFSLNFSKLEFEYKEQKPDGTLGGAVKAGYDVKAGKKV